MINTIHILKKMFDDYAVDMAVLCMFSVLARVYIYVNFLINSMCHCHVDRERGDQRRDGHERNVRVLRKSCSGIG